MKTVMDSVNEITPGLHGRARRKRVVPPRTAVMADSRRRAPKAVLPETGRFQYHTPVQLRALFTRILRTPYARFTHTLRALSWLNLTHHG